MPVRVQKPNAAPCATPEVARASTTWLNLNAAQTNTEYGKPLIRSFHGSLLRAYDGMQRAQACVPVMLSRKHFGSFESLRHSVWCCRGADNTPPRICCQDRELILRFVNPELLGTDIGKHGGGWLSESLVFSFIAGLTDLEVPDASFVCKRPLGISCPGKKANEAHQILRDIELAKKKEKKTYVAYEPSDMDLAND